MAHRSELDDLSLAACNLCGAEVSTARERAYLVGDEDEHVLCFTCAIRRGGVYDERHDAWTRPPDVAGLT